MSDATGRNTQTPIVPVKKAPAVKTASVQPPTDEIPVEEPTGRLTGPGAKAARKPTQPQMTAEVLGRERR